MPPGIENQVRRPGPIQNPGNTDIPGPLRPLFNIGGPEICVGTIFIGAVAGILFHRWQIRRENRLFEDYSTGRIPPPDWYTESLETKRLTARRDQARRGGTPSRTP